MPNSTEVYSWGETQLYAWQGSASAAWAFAESVEVTIDDTYRKHMLFSTANTPLAARTHYVQGERNVVLQIGALYAGNSFFQLMNSATNVSAIATLINGADAATAQFVVWSARIATFQGNAAEGGVWHQKIKIIGPDISGV